MDKEPQANENINPVAPVATNPNQEEEEEEFITPPDIAFFYDQLVEVAMGIIVDCKNVVETVDRINTVNDHDTSYIHEDSETKKENLGAAGKRVLGTAGLLMKNISKFVADNKDLYLEEKVGQDFKLYYEYLNITNAHHKPKKKKIVLHNSLSNFGTIK